MRKVITVEQAESVHLSGGEVWFRFPHWGSADTDVSFRDSRAMPFGPATLHGAYDVRGQWHHLNVGVPIFSVEVE